MGERGERHRRWAEVAATVAAECDDFADASAVGGTNVVVRRWRQLARELRAMADELREEAEWLERLRVN